MNVSKVEVVLIEQFYAIEILVIFESVKKRKQHSCCFTLSNSTANIKYSLNKQRNQHSLVPLQLKSNVLEQLCVIV